MFPTTVWTQIQSAGTDDDAALAAFAEQYRPAVIAYLRRRGFGGAEADDLCHDVFIRVLSRDVLARADPERGRFRALLRTITDRVAIDAMRRRKSTPVADLDPADDETDFDHVWTLELVARALDRLRAEGQPAFDVIEKHLRGERQHRQRLWQARRTLSERIRAELAATCVSRADLEAELAHLARYLRPRGNTSEKS